MCFFNLFKATLSARIPRESDVTTTPSSNFQSTTTSEESSEEFEKIKADFEKTLNKKEQEEFNQIVACVQSAKTLDESLTSVVMKHKLFIYFEF